jgi:hypothetical protein
MRLCFNFLFYLSPSNVATTVGLPSHEEGIVNDAQAAAELGADVPVSQAATTAAAQRAAIEAAGELQKRIHTKAYATTIDRLLTSGKDQLRPARIVHLQFLQRMAATPYLIPADHFYALMQMATCPRQLLQVPEATCLSGEAIVAECMRTISAAPNAQTDHTCVFFRRSLFNVQFSAIYLQRAVEAEDFAGIFEAFRLALPLLAFTGHIHYAVYLLDSLATYASLSGYADLRKAYQDFMCWPSGSGRALGIDEYLEMFQKSSLPSHFANSNAAYECAMMMRAVCQDLSGRVADLLGSNRRPPQNRTGVQYDSERNLIRSIIGHLFEESDERRGKTVVQTVGGDTVSDDALNMADVGIATLKTFLERMRNPTPGTKGKGMYQSNSCPSRSWTKELALSVAAKKQAVKARRIATAELKAAQLQAAAPGAPAPLIGDGDMVVVSEAQAAQAALALAAFAGDDEQDEELELAESNDAAQARAQEEAEAAARLQQQEQQDEDWQQAAAGGARALSKSKRQKVAAAPVVAAPAAAAPAEALGVHRDQARELLAQHHVDASLADEDADAEVGVREQAAAVRRSARQARRAL